MKFILQIICVFAVLEASLCALNEKEQEATIEKCREQVGASKEDIKVLDKHNGTLPTTKKQLCLTACFYKVIGMMDADNKFVLSKAIEEIEPLKQDSVDMYNKMSNVIKECIKTVVPDKSDECTSVKLLLDCVQTKIQALGTAT